MNHEFYVKESIWLFIIFIVLSIACNYVVIESMGYDLSGFLGGLFGPPLVFLSAKILEMED